MSNPCCERTKVLSCFVAENLLVEFGLQHRTLSVHIYSIAHYRYIFTYLPPGLTAQRYSSVISHQHSFAYSKVVYCSIAGGAWACTHFHYAN